MCTGFIAADRRSGELIGCAFASFMAAEALLPPPWPTSKPPRFYTSNLAVLPEHRRRGAALALLKACELLGGCIPSYPPQMHGTRHRSCKSSISLEHRSTCMPEDGALGNFVAAETRRNYF